MSEGVRGWRDDGKPEGVRAGGSLSCRPRSIEAPAEEGDPRVPFEALSEALACQISLSVSLVLCPSVSRSLCVSRSLSPSLSPGPLRISHSVPYVCGRKRARALCICVCACVRTCIRT